MNLAGDADKEDARGSSYTEALSIAASGIDAINFLSFGRKPDWFHSHTGVDITCSLSGAAVVELNDRVSEGNNRGLLDKILCEVKKVREDYLCRLDYQAKQREPSQSKTRVHLLTLFSK